MQNVASAHSLEIVPTPGASSFNQVGTVGCEGHATVRLLRLLSLPQYVITAPSMVVASPGRAIARTIASGKIEALTLIAPPPVRLPSEIPAIFN